MPSARFAIAAVDARAPVESAEAEILSSAFLSSAGMAPLFGGIASAAGSAVMLVSLSSSSV